MIITFPPPPPGSLSGYLSRCFQLVKDALGRVLAKDEATPYIILQDSSKVSWTISVTTSGALTTLRNSGKTRP